MVYPSSIPFLVLALGGLELWNRSQSRNNPGAAEYYRVKPWQRVAVGGTYIGLGALLALGMSATHIERTF